jgi:DNA-binding GntR family transcriptional regulator
MLSRRSIPDGVSMYRWVAEQLRNEIMEEKWEKGSGFLSETQIMEMYRVSRATARRAMDVLEEDGLIERRQGSGTFVSSPVIEQNFDDFHSFAYDAEKDGRRVSFKILSLE